MRRTLRIFGIEVLSYETEPDLYYEVEQEEASPEGITGGSSHNFERDLNPIDPSGEEPWEFGFHT